jgi:hypothetical protein
MSTPLDNRAHFETEGMPALYYAADKASTASQSLYLKLLLAVLICTVAGPMFLVLAPLFPNHLARFRYLAGAALLAALVITGRIKESRKEREWYGARAVAESVKTSAWRYAMAAEPYLSALSAQEVDRLFLDNLKGVLRDAKELNYSAGSGDNSKPQITDAMRALRSKSWAERMQVYVEQRIQGQRRWYSGKAHQSSRWENIYFGVIIILQLVAMLTAFAFAVWSGMTVNLTGMITSMVAALFVWLQAKRYQETAQSYSVTSHELGFVEETSKHVKSESEFASFVADSENAMSREHTLWVARRRG